VSNRFIEIVLAAIGLDQQTNRVASEVDNRVIDRNLAADVKSVAQHPSDNCATGEHVGSPSAFSRVGPPPQTPPRKRAFTPVFDGLWGRGFRVAPLCAKSLSLHGG
jgi:hypothetical protein